MNAPHRAGRLTRLPSLVFAVFALLLAASPLASAQTPVPEQEVRTISVSGQGRVTATPDTANVRFGIEARNEELSVAQDEVSAGADSLTSALTEAGVSEEDIQTAVYEVMPVNEYDDDGNFERVDHYQVLLVLQVTVRDIEQVGTLLDQGVAAGATYVGSISFYVSDPSPYLTQAREAAVNDARAKADDYARLSGAIITGVFSLEETSSPAPAAEEYFAADGMMEAEAASARSVPVSPGSTEIVVTIDVEYAIEPGNG